MTTVLVWKEIDRSRSVSLRLGDALQALYVKAGVSTVSAADTGLTPEKWHR
jgi:hypothetical protein